MRGTERWTIAGLTHWTGYFMIPRSRRDQLRIQRDFYANIRFCVHNLLPSASACALFQWGTVGWVVPKLNTQNSYHARSSMTKDEM
jgi:hypothetical protein